MPSSRRSNSSYHPVDGLTVDNKYILGKVLGRGSFGEIRLAHRTDDESKKVAIKLELISNRRHRRSTLEMEAKFYQLIKEKAIEREHFAKFHGLTVFGMYRALIVELLGPSLDDCLRKCHGRFTIKTVLQIAVQLMDRFESLHNIEIVYRDVKPENFLLGLPGGPRGSQLHIVDFGLSKKLTDDQGNHIPYKEGPGTTGTARYMSLRAHSGGEQSRRDDMAAIGYMLVYLIKGSLPWQGLARRLKLEGVRDISHTRLQEEIAAIKSQTTIGELCTGLPKVFAKYMRLVRELQFTEKPDYSTYRTLFINESDNRKIVLDNQFDWDRRVSEGSVADSHDSSATINSFSIRKFHGSAMFSDMPPKSPPSAV
ncbi:Casein kinase I isoform gamma-2 [Halotydeus destructor]|nr:Casein kinase I isoform gamma-2 [Halotydeus destructor]